MSLERPSVSIVVSAYEGISYLPATIDSILQQTNDNFEILVFSDSYSRIHAWFRRQPDSRLRFILQSNLGLADIYNQGLLEARGKYIAFIRAGDLWHPSKLQKQVCCLDRYSEIGLVYSTEIDIDRQNKSVGINTSRHLDNWGQPPEILAHNQLPSSSVMLRRTCFERVGLFDPKIELIPDWEMWIRLSHHYEFMAISEPLVYCRQLPIGRGEGWLELERDLHTTIEKAYGLRSPEPEQKNRSYSYASLFLAQSVLQDKNSDPVIAHNYWYQALQHDALIVFSPEFCRLRWVIFYHALQSDRHSILLRWVRATGDLCQRIISALGEYGQKMLTWMLEEEDSINLWKNRKIERQGKDL